MNLVNDVSQASDLKLHPHSTIPLSNLRLLKDLRGLSYSTIAKATGTGYSREYFFKTMKGAINPCPLVKKALGDFFGIDPLRVAWGLPDD